MNQRQIPKGFDIFYTNFRTYRADVAQKTFFEKQKREQFNSFNFFCNANDVTVTFLKKTSNGNDVTISIFRKGK
jgi:hypothetical protein